MQIKLEFNNKCTACGTARRKEELAYAKDVLKPYCANIMVCNSDHPNSYSNVLAKQGEIVDMLSFREAQAEFAERLLSTASDEDKQVIKMVQHPITIRIEDYDLASHVIQFKEKEGIPTITDAFRELVREHMELTKKAAEPAPVAMPFIVPPGVIAPSQPTEGQLAAEIVEEKIEHEAPSSTDEIVI